MEKSEEQVSREQEREIQWQRWSKFIACGENNISLNSLDVLIVVPPVNYREKINISDSESIEPVLVEEDVGKQISIGSTLLASEAERYGLKSGILYGEHTRIKRGNGEIAAFSPAETAKAILASRAKLVGVSLFFPNSLEWLKQVRLEIEKQSGGSADLPRIITGGSLSSLASKKVREDLMLDEESVVVGRGFPELRNNLILVGGVEPEDKVDPEERFNPNFLIPPGSKNLGEGKSNLIYSLYFINNGGGLGCLGGRACEYCGGWYLGEKQKLNVDKVKKQIDLMASVGIKYLSPADNYINTSNTQEANRFIELAKYAQERGMTITSFFIRPEFAAKTDMNVLAELVRYGVNSAYMGVEFTNAELLYQTGRISENRTAQEYLETTRRAFEKLIKVDPDFKVTLSVMLAYPGTTREVDKQTLDHIAIMLNTTRGVRKQTGREWHINQVNVDLYMTQLIPGSDLYNRYVEQGVKPADIWRYNLETRRRWDLLLAKLNGAQDSTYNFISIEKMIAEKSPDVINEILNFTDERRLVFESIQPKK